MKYSQFFLFFICAVNVSCLPVTQLPGIKSNKPTSRSVNTRVLIKTGPEPNLVLQEQTPIQNSVRATPIPNPQSILASPTSMSRANSSANDIGSPIFTDSSSRSSGRGGSSGSKSEPLILDITDIVLSETKESILHSQSTAFLSGSVSRGTPLKITLKGSFPVTLISQEKMQFTHEAGLLRQTHEKGDAPQVYALMDDVLLWNPINISPQSIELELDSHNLLEFALSGQHTLALITPEQSIEKSILLQIHEDDENTSALSPQILSSQLTIESEESPYLKIVGYHFPLSPALATVKINQQTYPVIHTQVFTDGRSESFIDLRGANSLSSLEDAFLVYKTPFGQTIEKIGS